MAQIYTKKEKKEKKSTNSKRRRNQQLSYFVLHWQNHLNLKLELSFCRAYQWQCIMYSTEQLEAYDDAGDVVLALSVQ